MTRGVDGFRSDKGYGRLYVRGTGYAAGGLALRSRHRWVWEQAHGPIPKGMVIMHTCDNPAVELTHLRSCTLAARISSPGRRAASVNYYDTWHMNHPSSGKYPWVPVMAIDSGGLSDVFP